MDKQKVFEHFSRVLDTMIDQSAFFKIYFQEPLMMEYDIVGSSYVELSPNINIFAGCTRSCIVDRNFDYVVKFDTDTDDWGGSICEREAEIYDAAKISNVADCFNEIVYIGTYTRTFCFYTSDNVYRYCPAYWSYSSFMEEYEKCDKDKFGEIVPITISIPLYACPKAEHYSFPKMSSAEFQKAKQSVKSVKSPLYERNIAIAFEFIQQYGYEKYVELSHFSINHFVNDIHFNNIGSVDGRICLIDYAGYHADFDEE